MYFTFNHCLCAAIFWGTIGIMVGCGEKEPSLIRVTGQITVDGVPVDGMTVIFYPDKDRGTTGPASFGETDANGNYSLSGPNSRLGAIPGFHKVTFSCPMAGSTPNGRRPPKLSPCNLPKFLSDPNTTDKMVEVRAGQEEFDFELKSKPLHQVHTR